jgi:hypothetical protein
MNGNKKISECLIAVGHVINAMEIAISFENMQRYNFLVYNSSVILWKIVQPFLRPGRAKTFSSEMLKMSTNLETINDSDKEWRILYLSGKFRNSLLHNYYCNVIEYQNL